MKTATLPTPMKTDLLAEAIIQRIQFVPQASNGATVLLRFRDPEPHAAIVVDQASPLTTSTVDLMIVPHAPTDHVGGGQALVNWVTEENPTDGPLPIVIPLHGTQIVWGGQRVALQCAPEREETLRKALVDFCYYESELRKLEGEIRAHWEHLAADTPWAIAVARPDPERFHAIRQRMQLTLQRRLRLARLRPYLYEPRPNAVPLANQLLDRLREKTQIDERYESALGQLEVAERVYEMNSQKIHDFQLARKSHTLEWAIVVLLLVEVVLLIFGLLTNTGG